MRSRSLILTTYCSLTLSAAVAQSQPGPAHFLRHPSYEPHIGLVLLPGGSVPALPAVAPIPTIRAAAVYAPVLAPTVQHTPFSAEEPAPRHDLTGSHAYPPYDSYQNLPEAFRKHTLPDVWAQPLPLQLLRSALGR